MDFTRKQIRELRERREIIDALGAEVERQRESLSVRASAMTTRLSVLVAAASVTGGLQLTQGQPTPWYVVGVFLAGMAALLGGVGLWPRGGGENGVEDLQDELWNEPPAVAAYVLVHRKLEILKDDESTLKFRAWFARFGFLALGLSVIAIAIHLTRIL